MSFPFEYTLPIFVGTGSVLTSGHSGDLGKGQLALVHGATGSVVTSASVSRDTPIKLAQGSWHNVDKLGQFVGGLTQSDKTPEFLVKDILQFERSKPRKAVSEQWILGWDGTNACGSFAFETGKTYRFSVKVWGEDVYGMFLRPIQREITYTVAPNAAGTNVAVGTKEGAQEIARLINADPQLKYFVKAEAIHSDYVATTATHHVYTLVVADTGDAAALAAVQASAGRTAVRVDRTGIMSTYEVVATSLPSAFTPGVARSLAECDGTCPTGYTLKPEQEGFIVTRPLAGTEDLTTSNLRSTFASTIAAAYFPAKTFNGATAVDPTTNQITLTAHGLVANAAIVYSNGGGTTIVGLTNGATYYVKTVVDANNVTLSATPGGTVIDITADGVGASHTLTPKVTSTFLSQNGAVATIQIEADKLAVDPTALLSDSLTKTFAKEAVCIPPTASSTAWIVGAERYTVTRKLCITLPKICGTGNRLAELQAFYANTTGIDTIALETAGTCSDTYSVNQTSVNQIEDGCLSEGLPEFANLQSFEGFVWAECPCLAEDAGDSTVKAGVRITAAYENTKFGGCSFSPVDYYSVRPLKLEVTELVHGPGVDDNGALPVSPIPSRLSRHSSMATQGGEWLIREFIRANRYRVHGEFFADPRLREVLDSTALEVVDRNANYVSYHVKVRQNRRPENTTSQEAEILEFIVAFKEGEDASAFETAISSVAALAGVALKDR